MNHRRKRGVAIEYVLLTMGLVASLIVAILTAASLTAQKSRRHKTYIERKEFLDNVAEQYIAQMQNIGNVNGFAAQFSENDFGFELHVSTSELTVTQDRTVLLLVELARTDSQYKVVTYKYGLN